MPNHEEGIAEGLLSQHYLATRQQGCPRLLGAMDHCRFLFFIHSGSSTPDISPPMLSTDSSVTQLHAHGHRPHFALLPTFCMILESYPRLAPAWSLSLNHDVPPFSASSSQQPSQVQTALLRCSLWLSKPEVLDRGLMTNSRWNCNRVKAAISQGPCCAFWKTANAPYHKCVQGFNINITVTQERLKNAESQQA